MVLPLFSWLGMSDMPAWMTLADSVLSWIVVVLAVAYFIVNARNMESENDSSYRVGYAKNGLKIAFYIVVSMVFGAILGTLISLFLWFIVTVIIMIRLAFPRQ